MLVAVRCASAITVSIGFAPEQVGMPLESPIQTPGVSCSSPLGSATEVFGSEPRRALDI